LKFTTLCYRYRDNWKIEQLNNEHEFYTLLTLDEELVELLQSFDLPFPPQTVYGLISKATTYLQEKQDEHDEKLAAYAEQLAEAYLASQQAAASAAADERTRTATASATTTINLEQEITTMQENEGSDLQGSQKGPNDKVEKQGQTSRPTEKQTYPVVPVDTLHQQGKDDVNVELPYQGGPKLELWSPKPGNGIVAKQVGTGPINGHMDKISASMPRSEQQGSSDMESSNVSSILQQQAPQNERQLRSKATSSILSASLLFSCSSTPGLTASHQRPGNFTIISGKETLSIQPPPWEDGTEQELQLAAKVLKLVIFAPKITRVNKLLDCISILEPSSGMKRRRSDDTGGSRKRTHGEDLVHHFLLSHN